MIHLKNTTRIEIIDDTGRVFSRWEIDGVALDGQDEGQTLKIFLDYGGEDENTTITILQAALLLLRKGNAVSAAEAIERHLKQIMGGDQCQD